MKLLIFLIMISSCVNIEQQSFVVNKKKNLQDKIYGTWIGERVDDNLDDDVYFPYKMQNSMIITKDSVFKMDNLNAITSSFKYEGDSSLGCYHIKMFDLDACERIKSLTKDTLIIEMTYNEKVQLLMYLKK